ncbi:hypothetical protein [Stutzerimonas azotifigens]|uniref:hypothetical protein n=1 Tax=Stutzerimonas azotifigens TaxID=291995 RepID=UPI00041623E8|nr:hypothetical protein [Stutzerimonas azotifigens]
MNALFPLLVATALLLGGCMESSEPDKSSSNDEGASIQMDSGRNPEERQEQ